MPTQFVLPSIDKPPALYGGQSPTRRRTRFYYLSYKMMGLQADRVPDMSDVMTRLGNLEARVGE